MTEPYSGGCLCGAVRYTCTAAPMIAGLCHCRDCQRHTGTGHAAHLAVPKAALTVEGELSFYPRPADSGNIVKRGFCPTCGSGVMSENDGFPDMLFLRAGSLDEPGAFQPSLVVYASRAHAWDQVDPALPKIPEMPDPAQMPST